MSKNIEVVKQFLCFYYWSSAHGAMTADKKIILTQGGPAILTLLSILFWDKKTFQEGSIDFIK